MLETKFTKLIGCKVPIQQAGMAALPNPELAAAVSKTGALGMVSVGGLSAEKVILELEQVKTLTPNTNEHNFLITGEAHDDLDELREPVREPQKHAALVAFSSRDT